MLPAVLYRSGQLLDIARLAAAARVRGIPMGFDCAHSIGAVPHRFDDWGVDLAFWCTYKCLNAGPGATGGSTSTAAIGARARARRLVGL